MKKIIISIAAAVVFALAIAAVVTILVIKPSCNSQTYSVTFVVDEHAENIPQNLSGIESGSTIAEPDPEPVLGGYTFDGWYTAEEGGNKWNFEADKVTGNLTLYAHWTEDEPATEYTVTFHYNYSGANPATTTATTVNGIVAEPTTPTRTDGYTFEGWYTQAENGDKYVFTTKLTQNTDLYAHWTEDEPATEYTVTFHYNYEGAEPATTTATTVNGIVAEPTTPTRTDGYTFEGWYTQAENGDKYVFSTKLTQNTDLYAHWTKDEPAQEYTVTFDYNYDNKGTYQTAQTLNGKITAPANNPERTGYTFEGWYETTTGGTAFDFGTSITSAKTLYAHWTINKYTVTFSEGEATGAQNIPGALTDVEYGSTIQEPNPAPTCAGYTFQGWYTTSGREWQFESDKVTDNLQLVAHWTKEGEVHKEYKVQFNLNGGDGSAPAEQTIIDGGKVEPVDEPKRTGYTFAGWYTEEDAGNLWNFSDDTVTDNVTLYAHWTINKYTVTFDLVEEEAKGGPADIQNVEYNTTINRPTEVPELDGYTFDDWYKAADGNEKWDFANDKVTGETTLYAHWTINKYTVTFDLVEEGAKGGPADIQNVEYNTTIDRPTEVPELDGYTFDDWYKAADGNEKWDFANDKVTGETTLYAHWTKDEPAQEYTVTFDYNYDNKGTYQTAQTVNGKITAPTENPKRDGYTFEGWYETTTGGTAFDFGTSITSAKTLYAHWTINKYTVTFDLVEEGATGSPADIQNVEYNTTIDRPGQVPELDGYTFDDWYKAADGNEKWDFDTDVVTQNTTLYAHWTKNSVTPPQPGNYKDVTLIVDQIEDINKYVAECAGADTGTSDDDVDAAQHTIYDDTFTQIIANAGVRYNSSTQDFDGVKSTIRLQTRGNGSATSKSIKLVLASNAVIKVYARSSSKTPGGRQFGLYNSAYEIITQSPAPTAQEQHIYEYSVSAAGIYYLGSTNGFDIYAISIDYDSTVVPPEPATEYTVTFHYNYSGANPATTTATTKDGIVAEPTTPTRTDGYTFEGWYTQAENGDKFVFTTKLTQDTDLYAHWTKNSVTPPEPGKVEELSINITELVSSGVLSETTYESETPLAGNGLVTASVLADSTNTVVVDKNDKSSYTHRLKLSGSGSETARSVKLVITQKAIVKVYIISSSSQTSGERDIGLFTGSKSDSTWASVGDTQHIPADSILHELTFNAPSAGTYYLAAVSGGSNIYEIIVTPDNSVNPPATEYTVTFHYNYSGANPATTTATTVNGIVAEPTTPTRTDGYTFEGWYTQAENGDKFVFTTKLTQDTDLYAHWTKDEPAQEYTVTFDYNYDNKGTYQTAQTVNGKVTAPANNPERTGYTFEGWYEEPACEHRFEFSTVLTADKTLYANWTQNAEEGENVTVTFQTNGGSTVAEQTFKAGDTATRPETDPTYGENVFCGWYSDPDCTQEYKFGEPVNADITIYALWKHWVSKENVAVGSIINSAQSSIGSDGKLTKEYQYNDHITFPVGMKPESGNINTQGKSPITLTISGDGLYEIYIHGIGASSDKQSQIIIKNGTDGTATELASSALVGSKAELSVTLTNLKAGTYYIYSTNSVRMDTFTIRELVPLDQSGNPGGDHGGGEEESTYTVTFDSNPGGTYTVISNIQATSTIDKPEPDPTRYGYEFDGWHTDPVENSPWDFDSGMVTSSFTLYAHWKVDSSVETNPDVTEFVTVKYTVNGSEYFSQRVEKGQKATQPKDPSEDNKQFVGWYETDPGTLFNFDTPIVKDTNLTAKFENLAALQVKVLSVGAYNESLYVTWEDNSPESAQVEYKAVGATDWIKVDAPLVRKDADGNARVDIVGLKAGSYNVRITTSAKVTSELPGAIAVAAYDRSGYAHFNYTSGIGAYYDDGTLKEGALVIYVTDTNKNNILDYAYVNGQKVDISEYMKATQAAGGVTAGQQTSIGALLNNRRYSGDDRMNVGIAKLCEVYGSVAIRIVGKVSAEMSGSMDSAIDGLTSYNSTDNGGSLKDNGRMARMVNAHDLTIEGIGDDASIYGWGVHFIASGGKTGRMGTSFEVRNVTFERYPEDAVGMEGEQSGSVINVPVERCWIHNNTFLPGYASSPAESDKAEGDGSCDFKRGQYLTVAYNWFEYCHKTNLVGSSDDSLQYNLTYHHNVWWQCGSRIPLTRQANVHFYNNYVYGDATEAKTPYPWISKPDLSYVHSLRANCYIFSEANYYDGCKDVTDEKSGGAAKGWNNIYYSTFGANSIKDVTSREQAISNNCAYNGTDYSKFDTDEKLFYYDKANNVSRCLLDNAVVARQKDLMYSGANGHGSTKVDLQISMPEGALQIPDNGKLTVTIGTNQQGIIFNGVSSQGKYKGMGIIFTLSAEAALTITTTSTGDPAPDIISVDGIVYAHKFEGTLQIVLPAGTYIVASGQKDKETVITAMTFENTAASSQARIDAAKAAIEKLPEAASVQLSNAADIKAARTAYNSLTAAEKKTFDEQNAALVKRLTDCEAKLSELQIENVRSLINAIGEVTDKSYPQIEAAQNAYNALNAAQQAQLTAEKAILDKAVADFAKFAVQSLINSIEAWKDKVDGVPATDREQVEALIKEGESLESLYDGLDNGEDGGTNEQANVNNYADLTAGMATLAEYQKVFVFEDALDAFESTTVTSADASKVAALKKAYEDLTPEQQGALTSEKTQKYNDIIKSYNELMAQGKAVSFDGAKSSDEGFVITGKIDSRKEDFTAPDGVTKLTSALKMQQGTTITFTTTGKMTLTLYFTSRSSGRKINVDDAEHTAAASGDYVTVVVTIGAGTHTITKNQTDVDLFYLTLTPAA